MPSNKTQGLSSKGLNALRKGNIILALACFEKAVLIEPSPVNHSCLAFCIARERGQFKKAISLCKDAIEKEPENYIHYLNLGRVYLLSGKREDAIKTFRDGLGHGENQEIINELERLGIRKPPVFPFLKRSNPLNKYLGIILKRFGYR